MGIKQEIDLTPDKPKKSHNGLWIAILSVIATAIVGIGIATIIINLPRTIEERAEDVATNVINNLLSSEALSASGDFTFTPKYIAGITPTFTGNIALKDNKPIAKISNLADLYYNQYHDQIVEYLKTRISAEYNKVIAEKCVEGEIGYHSECSFSTNEDLKASREENLNALANTAYTQIGQMIDILNDKWFIIAAEDMQTTGLFPKIEETELAKFPAAVNCIAPSLKSEGSLESLTELYKQYPFIAFSEAKDNFHYIDLDYTNAANVIKAMPETEFGKQFTECSKVSLENTEKTKFLARRLESESRFYPDILIRLDDTNNYLSDLKLLADNNGYFLSMSTTISYNDESESIEELANLTGLIEQIRQIINNTSTIYYNSYIPSESILNNETSESTSEEITTQEETTNQE